MKFNARNAKQHLTQFVLTCFMLLNSPTIGVMAQPLRIQETHFTRAGRFAVMINSDTNSYYVLLRSDMISENYSPVGIAMGEAEMTELVDANERALIEADEDGIDAFGQQFDPEISRRFYRIQAVPVLNPLDLDADGIDDIYELTHAGLNPLLKGSPTADFDRDGVSDLQEYLQGTASDDFYNGKVPSIELRSIEKLPDELPNDAILVSISFALLVDGVPKPMAPVHLELDGGFGHLIVPGSGLPAREMDVEVNFDGLIGVVVHIPDQRPRGNCVIVRSKDTIKRIDFTKFVPTDKPSPTTFPLKWELVTSRGILRDSTNPDPDQWAWHAGRVETLLPWDDASKSVLAGTGNGLWLCTARGTAICLSDDWPITGVTALRRGVNAKHVFASVVASYAPQTAIMETDRKAFIPLLSSWRTIAAPPTVRTINDLLPIASRNLLLAATDNGLWWSSIPPESSPASAYSWVNAGFTGTNVYSLALGPEDSVVAGVNYAGIFVGTWNGSSTLTFAESSAGLFPRTPFSNMGLIRVVSSEYNRNFMYSIASEPGLNNFATVMKSADGGRSWTDCLPSIREGSQLNQMFDWTFLGEQATDNFVVAVSPFNPQVAMIGNQNGPYVTKDGGKEWAVLDAGAHGHADCEFVEFDKADATGNSFWIGSHGGLIYTSDGGAHFHSRYNRSLPNLQCYSPIARQFYGTLGVNPLQTGVIASGLHDNGNVVFLPENDYWLEYERGDGGLNMFGGKSLLFHNTQGSNNPFVRYSSFSASRLAAAQIVYGQVGKPSTIPDSAWNPEVERLHETFFAPNGKLIQGVAVNGDQVLGLYLDASGKPLFEKIAQVPLAYPGAYLQACGSFNGDVVYVASTGSGLGNPPELFKIEAKGGAVTKMQINFPATWRNGSQITVSQIKGTDSTHAFAACLYNDGFSRATGALFSTQDGIVWNQSSSPSLPSDPLFAMETRFEGGAAILFLATESRVLESANLGVDWVDASFGLPNNVQCADLRSVQFQGRDKYLYLSTWGRSVWRAKLP